MNAVTAPKRIRLSRAKGWRLADQSSNYKVVSRPGRFGNPFTLEWVRLSDPNISDHDARIVAVQTFYRWLTDDTYAAVFPASLNVRRAWILEHLHELAGKDLCCWCPLPAAGEADWCHARSLLDLANHPLIHVDTDGTP